MQTERGSVNISLCLLNRQQGVFPSTFDRWSRITTRVSKMAMFKNDEQIEQLQSPLAGYETCPLVSLEEAVKPLVSLVHDVEQMANDAKCRCEEPEEGLTTDESASIMLNTMQWRPSSECLHNKLNSALRSQSRSSTKSWFLYLKLLFTALWKLPSKRRFVYRIVHGDMSQDCREGDIITWWSFSSCTTSLTALQGFFKTNEDRTIFTVDCDSDRDIRHHSCLSNEDEILLLPDQQFKVEDCSQPARGLHMIRLREVQPGSVLLSLPLPSRSSASEGEVRFISNDLFPVEFEYHVQKTTPAWEKYIGKQMSEQTKSSTDVSIVVWCFLHSHLQVPQYKPPRNQWKYPTQVCSHPTFSMRCCSNSDPRTTPF